MYLRPAFTETDTARICALIRANSFGLLVTHGPRGIEATHIPFTLTNDSGALVLAGHLAAANPQCEAVAAGASALAVFGGPHAYISPGWYVTQPAVPTWDYAAVHVTGRLRANTDAAVVSDSLQALAAGDPNDFQMDAMPPDYRDRMIRGIRAFTLRADTVEAQWKMSQNRSIEDRKAVIRGLRGQGDALSAAVADMIAETL